MIKLNLQVEYTYPTFVYKDVFIKWFLYETRRAHENLAGAARTESITFFCELSKKNVNKHSLLNIGKPCI